jgi:hypothetical protein
MRDLLRKGNTQDGDAIRLAQCNETATPKNSWNKTRIFGASFSANVFARQEVRMGEILPKLFFDPASIEFSPRARINRHGLAIARFYVWAFTPMGKVLARTGKHNAQATKS